MKQGNVEIRLLTKDRAVDLNLKNEAFPLYGFLRPSYIAQKWSYTVEHLPLEQVSEMAFPDENYDYDEMISKGFVLGAYVAEVCVGIAILQESWNRYLYLYDLKVRQDYRGLNIGRKLIKAAKEKALKNGYLGLYTQAQDNNLTACLFYLNCGFEIGGLDTEIYVGTKQQGKKDIIFYTTASNENCSVDR